MSSTSLSYTNSSFVAEAVVSNLSTVEQLIPSTSTPVHVNETESGTVKYCNSTEHNHLSIIDNESIGESFFGDCAYAGNSVSSPFLWETMMMQARENLLPIVDRSSVVNAGTIDEIFAEALDEINLVLPQMEDTTSFWKEMHQSYLNDSDLPTASSLCELVLKD
jgi:hypothetical protein